MDHGAPGGLIRGKVFRGVPMTPGANARVICATYAARLKAVPFQI